MYSIEINISYTYKQFRVRTKVCCRFIPGCIKIMVYYSFVFIQEYNQINITHFYDKL